MLNREENLNIIREIRNLEQASLDSYIEQKLIPKSKDEPGFLDTLYKDINYVLDGVDAEGEGDLVIEDGDINFDKVTGYQTRLHDVCVWLHQQAVYKNLGMNSEGNFDSADSINRISTFPEEMEKYERDFLFNKRAFTPEYRKSLDEIKRSLVQERRENYLLPKFASIFKIIRLITAIILIIAVALFFLYKDVSIWILTSVIAFSLSISAFYSLYIDTKASFMLRVKRITDKAPLNIIIALVATGILSYTFEFERTIVNIATIFCAVYIVADETIKRLRNN